MPAEQGKARRRVIKRHLLPTSGRVTCLAVGAVPTFVNIIRPVTANAGLWRRIRLPRIMAGLAFDGGMLANQPEPGRIVIEPDFSP